MLHESILIGLKNTKIQTVIESGNAALKSLGGSKYPMIDAHVHMVNFLQETRGLKNLITHMDMANVQKAVIF